MKPGNIPETFADVLTLAKVAQSVSYYRPLGSDAAGATLSLQLDDYAADRRTCLEIRMASGKAGTVEVKTLCGYDPRGHRWSAYCEPAASVALPDRRGQKALLTWLTERSKELTGWPAAQSWSLFRPAAAPRESAVMRNALTY